MNAGIAAYEAALKANGKSYTIHIYPGTQHAFNNDTGAARYNKEAADLAWGRTLAFFKEHLGAPPNAADGRRNGRPTDGASRAVDRVPSRLSTPDKHHREGQRDAGADRDADIGLPLGVDPAMASRRRAAAAR